MTNLRFYFASRESIGRFINRWDLILLILLSAILFFLGLAANHMTTPYQLGTQIPISLDPSNLPYYSLRTVARMFIALCFSLIFSFIVGSLAARNRRAEKVIIPALDILQSVPVLSFLSITIAGFIHLFPGSLLGPECACIFAIFTSQVWNITFGFYQSMKTVPHDLIEASAMLQLSAWQRFWKVEVPFSMSGLLWNMMMSMSASWFFVVLSEAIAVAHQDIRLPGVGSYIALAIDEKDWYALGYAIITMVLVIFLYDQIFFRPLIAWSEKFKMEQSPDEEEYSSWLVNLTRGSQLMKRVGNVLSILREKIVNARLFYYLPSSSRQRTNPTLEKYMDWFWNILLLTICLASIWYLMQYILKEVTLHSIFEVFLLGSITAFRVLLLILLASLVWIPVGVWIGLRPRIAQKIQPVIQFVASIPANLFYPIFVIAIVSLKLNAEIWLTPLMILGTQWYILFNVIAGASNIPRDLYMVADNFGLKGWMWWKRLALPGIFPFYITGAITAAGGAWNASIVAEWVSWGDTTLIATGLGSYIRVNTIAGDFPQIALGTMIMCIYVLVFNHLIWRPLYRLAEQRFHLN